MRLARLVLVVAVLIALLIGVAITLQDVHANPHNVVVEAVHEGANFFAGAFTDMIPYSGHPDRAISVNWGIAAGVYLVLGALIAGVLLRIGWGGVRIGESRRPALR